MPKKERTCFFISPIKEKDSPERKRSDLVKKILIIPALEACGFEEKNVVRADEDVVTGRITENMVRHIQEDDLCIADLTGCNANVMYEYGLRKGLGRPCIMIRRAEEKDEKIFDVYDHNCVYYDLTSAEGLYDASVQIKHLVRAFEANNFSREEQRTYNDIDKKLNEIQDRLDKVLARVDLSDDSGEQSGNWQKLVRQLGVNGAFNYALKNREVEFAEYLMNRLEKSMDWEQYIDKVVEQVAAMGSRKAGHRLKEEWEKIDERMSLPMKYEALASYISFCNRIDAEDTEKDFVISKLEELRQKAIEDGNEDVEAGIYNQMNRFYHGLYMTLRNSGENHREYLEAAIDSVKEALNLDEDPSYYYNLATLYHALWREDGKAEDIQEAVKAIDKCLEKGTDDIDHLRTAFDIFKKANEMEKAARVKARLNAIDPMIGRILDL